MPIVNGIDYAKIGPDAIRVGKGGNSPMGRMLDHPDHFQSLLAEIVVKERPRIMVETGVESGYSTEHYLMAMDKVGIGHLFSFDPCPSGFFDANPIVHPRFTLIRKPSMEALTELFEKVGPFDIFLHDSDHCWENQTAEYEFAWAHTRSGGIIASDDTGWGVNTVSGTISHDAWAFFCLRHNVAHLRQKINNAEYFRKP